MPYLALQSHVSFGLVGGRPVFLDVRRDRYLALDRQGQAAFHAALNGQGPIAFDDPGARKLLETELFELTEGPRPPRAASSNAPCRGLSASRPKDRLRALDLPRCWFLVDRARRQLKSRPLEQVLAARRGPPTPSPTPEDTEWVEDLSARFRRTRSLVPIKPGCLQDSLALKDWLGRGPGVAIVVGVKLEPFAAHCWVQVRDAVLNDAPDKVAEFTPVLVVR